MKVKKQALIYLIGPTGVGKTEVSLELAKTFNSEIVAADSRQVYRGLDIGTAKPSLKEQKCIPHHMIDVVEPNQPFDVYQYIKLAYACIEEIHGRSKNVLIVGGTGLYIKALLDGIFKGPTKDESIRRRLEEEAKSVGLTTLYDRLKNVDPKGAQKIDPQNPRRIIRALEVYELTGKPISDFQTQWGNESHPATGDWRLATGDHNTLIIGLMRERGDLYARINQRVDQMFEKGLVEEVKNLFLRDGEKNNIITQAIGYQEVITYLRGLSSLDEAKELVKSNSRHFAKRQMTWFRRDSRIHWISIEIQEVPMDSASKIFDKINRFCYYPNIAR